MSIEYRSDYFDDPEARASFERYARNLFGLDFGRWKARGLWDAQYRPFSAFVAGECVATICVYPSAMRVGGKDRVGAQLLTVGTLPEYRLRGIQRDLWIRADAWINKHADFTFLFTDDSAAGFYDKLGFRCQPEFSEIIPCPPSANSAPGPFRQLNLDRDDDYAVVEQLARERTPVSDRLGVHNPNLLLFMFLYAYPQQTYFLEDLDALVVVEAAEDRLRVHDVVAREMPRSSDIMPFLARFEKAQVEFLFCTDRLGVEDAQRERVEDSLLFVRDELALDGEFVFPYSIRA
jgi:GNAT superfamily N-acetyltransferase